MIVGSFGVVGRWVGLRGEAAAFGGGTSLVSAETNISIARWIFGSMGAGCILLFAGMLYHWRTLR